MTNELYPYFHPYEDNADYKSFKYLIQKSFKNLPKDVSGIIADMAYEPPPFCGEEDGEDISHCNPAPMVSVTLQVSSEWAYILEWVTDSDDEPYVYIKRIGQERESTRMTCMLRMSNGGGDRIILMPFGFDLPEDTDEYTFSHYYNPYEH